jgi:hypothetical protein
MPKRKSCKKGYSRNRSTRSCRKNSKSRSKSTTKRKTFKRSKRNSYKSKRKSLRKVDNNRHKGYQVAVEYYTPPVFKKSKYGTLDIILEKVMNEDEYGNESIYFILARIHAINKSNLLKYLNNIGNMKKILEIDEL